MSRSSRLNRLAAYIPLLIVLYFAIQVVIRLLISPSLGKDEAEQVLLAQAFAWGYGSQPPLYTWLTAAIFGVVGEGIFGLTVLKNTLLAGTYLLTYATLRVIEPDRLLAALAAVLLLLIPQVAWESQRALTHSVLVIFASALFTYFMVRVLRHQRLSDYAMLGVAFAVGVMAKFNFPVIAVAMVLAAFSLSNFRRHVLHRGFLITVAVSALLLWRPLQWLLDNQQATLSRAHKLTNPETEGLLMTYASGLWGLGLSTVLYLTPLLPIFALAMIRSTAHKPTISADRRYLALFVRSIGIALAICAVLVVAFEVTKIKDRWLQPMLYVTPIALVLWAAPRFTARRAQALFAVAGICAFLVSIFLPLRTVVGPAFGRVNSLNSPYAELAGQIRGFGFDKGSILAGFNLLGGNMRLQFPRSVVVTPEYPSFRLPPSGPVLLVWDATHRKTVPPDLRALYKRTMGRKIPTVEVRIAEADLLYADRGTMHLGVVLIAAR